MSEVWKSTPKYWCKHCKLFVRDTALERRNHDATPRHQGNLKRFLRDLHRGHEREAQDQERAKAEVARLNGQAGSGAGGPAAAVAGSGRASSRTSATAYANPKPREYFTEKQRSDQLKQLVDLGVAVPDEFRGDLAMPGEWTVTSERIVAVEGDPDADGDSKDAIALGVRKRTKVEDEDEQESKKARWGRAVRTHIADVEDDLDALLSSGFTGHTRDIKKEDVTGCSTHATESSRSPPPRNNTDVQVKEEPPETSSKGDHILESVKVDEDSNATATVVFKKRKAKNIRSS